MHKCCVLSFFDNAYQKILKKSCAENGTFETVLQKYRDIFLDEIDNILKFEIKKDCMNCDDCLLRTPLFDDYVNYLNEFICDIYTRKELIKELFDEVIDIYIAAISRNRSVAMEMMKTYIENRCAYFNVESAMIFSTPMFRVRKVGDYDGRDIHELFHVPFDKRYLVDNARFSLAGIPLLYVAESLPLALQEVGCKINDANAAVFLPNYSMNYRDGLYDLSNHIGTNLIDIGIKMTAGSKLTYDHNMSISFKKSDMHLYLARFVLIQILHYPVNESCKGSFVQEYVLPQLMMDIVNEKAWIGVSYNSCKDYKWQRNAYKQYADKNMCFYVPYDKGKYNDILLSKYFYATWRNDEPVVTYKELIDKMARVKALNDNGISNKFNMNDYISYYVQIQMHLEKMSIVIGEQEYRRRKDCRVEMTLLYKLLEKIETIVIDPNKHGIIKQNM